MVIVITKMPFFKNYINIVNLTVIVVSRSCTRRKTNSRKKKRMFQIKILPQPKNFTQACL